MAGQRLVFWPRDLLAVMLTPCRQQYKFGSCNQSFMLQSIMEVNEGETVMQSKNGACNHHSTSAMHMLTTCRLQAIACIAAT